MLINSKITILSLAQRAIWAKSPPLLKAFLLAGCSLEPAGATEYEAKLLGIEMGALLMLEQRLPYNQDNQSIDYGKDLYRSDRFRLVTQITQLEV